jgi:phosphohistidine phosphatase
MAKPAVISLYLVRHGVAAERGERWPDDTKRPLTSDGIKKMRRATAGLRELDVDAAIAYTSPLVRAVQTAEIVVAGLKPSPDMKELPALAPGGQPAKVAEALGSLKAPTGIILVGHEPDLGELAAWLISAKAPLPFKKGGVCRIDLTGPASSRSGQLVWFATPKMLRALRS